MELETVIGLEVHIQTATDTGMWCRCSVDSFDAEPNTLVCATCLGLPGALPVMNEKAVALGITMALALNCEILKECKFDRKNYFYPDLPMGYQISQYDRPLSENGWLEVELRAENGELREKKKIGITRLHLENDAGKLTHEGEFSLVDFNRSGTPLMEIVSEPDLRSAAEARAYAMEVQKIAKRVGASDADMYKGQMRFDASVSLRPVGEDKLYPRMEIKNLNSFRSLESAIDYEVKRITQLWKEGHVPEKECTVGWIDDEQKTKVMREKESAADYRYFPCPDVPPLQCEESLVEKLRAELPELPSVYRERLQNQFGLSEHDAEIAVNQPNLGQFFEEVAEGSGDHKLTRTFVFSVLMAHLKEDLIDVSRCNVKEDHLIRLLKSIADGTVSASVGKEVLEETYATGKDPLIIIEERGLEQVSDEDELKGICRQVIEENASVVSDFKGGKEKAFAALVGKVMAVTKGRGNPQIISEIIRRLIS